MTETVCVVGAGRAGSVLAERLARRGVDVRTTGRELEVEGAEVVLLCVPDRALPEVARRVPAGPWVGHVSGATPLAVLEPHRRRFSLHPLQSFAPERGDEQLDGVWAALAGETPEALAVARRLTDALGLRSFELADGARALYHAGAVFASNYVVTLHAAAAELFNAAGAPPEALEPLMRGTLDSGFLLNGPLVRSDWPTVEAHLQAIHRARPELDPLYRVLVEATLRLLVWRRPPAGERVDLPEPRERRPSLLRRLVR